MQAGRVGSFDCLDGLSPGFTGVPHLLAFGTHAGVTSPVQQQGERMPETVEPARACTSLVRASALRDVSVSRKPLWVIP